MRERLPLDEAKLGTTSRALANKLLRMSAALRAAARMEAGAEPDGFSLVVEAESPTADSSRCLTVWLDESGTPSVEFGGWHTHGDVHSGGQSRPEQVAAIVDIVGAILRDEFVLISEPGSERPGHTSALDLRVPNALAEELTSKYSPGVVQIKSWSGTGDREAGIESTGFE